MVAISIVGQEAWQTNTQAADLCCYYCCVIATLIDEIVCNVASRKVWEKKWKIEHFRLGHGTFHDLSVECIHCRDMQKKTMCMLCVRAYLWNCVSGNVNQMENVTWLFIVSTCDDV